MFTEFVVADMVTDFGAIGAVIAAPIGVGAAMYLGRRVIGWVKSFGIRG